MKPAPGTKLRLTISPCVTLTGPSTVVLLVELFVVFVVELFVVFVVELFVVFVVELFVVFVVVLFVGLFVGLVWVDDCWQKLDVLSPPQPTRNEEKRRIEAI